MNKDTHIGHRKARRSFAKKLIGPAADHVLAWRSFVSGEVEVP